MVALNAWEAWGERGIAPPPISMLTSQSAMSAGTPSLSQEAFNTFLLTESNALVISQNVENSGQPLSCADDTRLRICIIADSVLRPGRNPCCSSANMPVSSHARCILRRGMTVHTLRRHSASIKGRR